MTSPRPLAIVLSLVGALFATSPISSAAEPLDLVKNSKRILFLGDSITASGQYVALFDAWIVTARWEKTPQVINCGLPSETISGLSEEGHAGGKFPRPDLFERLDRVLDLVKPDLVFACYGINCGIYQPFDEARFAKYQEGWKNLKTKVEAAGGKLIVITPPFYDDLRAPKDGFSYNEVLDRYSEWLLKQRENGWTVIDLHSPMRAHVKQQREKDPKFTLQPDGVHPNADGHLFTAQTLIAAIDDAPAFPLKTPEEPSATWKQTLPLVQQRMSVLRDAYVAAAGHKRPGVAKGLPLDEANKQTEELTSKINALLK
jgi:lysophospholipase L1-like esterase